MNKYWVGFVLVLSMASKITSEENCDKLGVLLYEDLGCEPHFKGTKTCPFKYSCKVLNNLENECYIKGHVYEIGEPLKEEAAAPCDIGCICSKGYDGGNFFKCAAVDCFEGPVKPGCYRKASPFQCCPGEEICLDKDTDRPQCEVEKNIYFDGQYFFPENTCMNCTCQPGFKGKLEEPFCKRIVCSEQRKSRLDLQNKCAPLYSSTKTQMCCPLFFVCPKGNETIEGEATADEVCEFGESKLKVGQFVQQENVKSPDGKVVVSKAKCECILPPLLTCKDLK